MPITDTKIKNITKRGFTQHKELNSEFFDSNKKMKPEVRKQLIKIADEFLAFLGIDHIDFDDVTLTGSLSNYNWNPYSDVDLHVIFDYTEIDDDLDLVREFFMAKKSLWNQEHDITIYDYEVELYGQDSNEPHHSTGVYSVLTNKWIVEPKPDSYKLNQKEIVNKSKHFMRLIDDVEEKFSNNPDDESIISVIDRIKQKVKKYRQSGLETGGEFSNENLVFKVLRRSDYLGKLGDIKTKAIDKQLSLDD